MKKVVKFGGSSLANAEQFEKVGDIIRSEESRRFVVPSAPGKRFDGDTKVTDLLYSCYDAAAKDGDFEKILEEIKSRYNEIIKGLSLTFSLDEDFQVIKENFKAQIGRDYAELDRCIRFPCNRPKNREGSCRDRDHHLP